MKRDARLKRGGERVEATLGGMYRRPRYRTGHDGWCRCDTCRGLFTLRIARSLRLPPQILDGSFK